MCEREFIRRDLKRRDRCQAANPLWTLEELHGLRHPPFVADPEFTPFDIDALGADLPNASASPSGSAQVRSPKRRHFCTVRGEFAIPHLVAGLPWRFAQHLEGPVVPEAEFAPLDLSFIK